MKSESESEFYRRETSDLIVDSILWHSGHKYHNWDYQKSIEAEINRRIPAPINK